MLCFLDILASNFHGRNFQVPKICHKNNLGDGWNMKTMENRDSYSTVVYHPHVVACSGWLDLNEKTLCKKPSIYLKNTAFVQ